MLHYHLTKYTLRLARSAFSLISTGWFGHWNFPLRFNTLFESLEPLQYLQTETLEAAWKGNLEAAWKGFRISIPSHDERLCPSWRENSCGTSDHCCELYPFFEYFTLIDEILLVIFINHDRERHHMASLNFYSLKSSLLIILKSWWRLVTFTPRLVHSECHHVLLRSLNRS